MKKIFLVLFVALLACQKTPQSSSANNSPPVQVDQDAAAAHIANQKAQSYSEWHMSEKNPDKIFANYMGLIIQKKITALELCDKFSSLQDTDLMLFENQIRSEDNQIALAPCRKDLINKLDIYWQDQHSVLEQAATSDNIHTNIRFTDTLVQLRDVSQGYYAVTGDLKQKQVILTFDDGPSGLYTEQILKILKQANVRAIFFELGQQVRRYPHLTQMVANDGHSIGSHSTTHACLPSRSICRNANGGKILTYSEAIAEIKGGHQAIFDALGWIDPFVRFPYGEGSIELKAYLRKNGIGEFLWNVDSEDWREKLENGKMNTMSVMIDNVMKELNSRQRGIVLFHDIQKRTAEALPSMLKRLYDEGYQPVVLQAQDNQARFTSQIVGPRKPIN